MAPPMKYHSGMLATRDNKKAAQRVVRLVPKALDDLDKALGETVEAMERGEVEPEDLAWESELSGDPHKIGR